ncbi:hypothetical protein K469DRAFT_602431 [Zopfia rhizophila CBS 207.26]|uniref:Swi5-domain-containing protein n=1 Tax=Zopfia rhizophila CBS 207.26 TaxID=1314779 RepID=A0A6A6DDV2_9PEZI|nr:hypothetical protein K469DRAFT_602431 [Zopfia rhizophila CBS 207.26]
MSTPAAKRRRLIDASKTLHKPFKSPFRTPLKPSSTANPPEPHSTEASIPQIPTPANENPAPASKPPQPTAITSLNPSTRLSSTPRPTQKKPSPSLTREIISLRSDIQTLTQAYALATSNKDADLHVLVDRWRIASQAAAEELFAGTRDRVNRMGGVYAWREREKEQNEWRRKWDREEMEAEREGRGEEGREYDRDMEVEEEREEEEKGGSKNDDTFTMDMMLKTLNIDLKLIGYDKEAQRWDG